MRITIAHVFDHVENGGADAGVEVADCVDPSVSVSGIPKKSGPFCISQVAILPHRSQP